MEMKKTPAGKNHERNNSNNSKSNKINNNNYIKNEFTTDWFSMRIQAWTDMFVPELAGKPGVRALEIGSYEGRCARWILDNLLTGRGCHLTCVDNFSYVDPQSARRGPATGRQVRASLLKNLAGDIRAGRASLLEGDADVVLRRFPLDQVGEQEKFDFIYVDADKESKAVLEQAVLAWPLLKSRGFLVFDDYTHSREHDQACPRPGIDAFLYNYARYLKVRHAGWQVVVQKRSRPLPIRGCRSEFYHEDLATI
jgi:Methyltransferase domain